MVGLESLRGTPRFRTSMKLLNTLRSIGSKGMIAELKEFQRSTPADLGLRAALAFLDFAGFKPEEYCEYLDHVINSGNASDKIYPALDYMLRQPPIDYKKANRELIRAINKFHRQLAILRDSPYLPRIASRTFQDLEEAFRNKEIPIPEDGNRDEVNLLQHYHDISLGLIQELREYGIGIKPLQGLTDFSQAIQELFNFDSHAPERLIDKLRHKKQQYTDAAEGDKKSLIYPSDTENEIEKARYFRSVSQHAQETLNTHFSPCLALSKAGAFPFIVDDTANGKSEEEAINSLLESLWHLVAKESGELNLETLVNKDKELEEIRSLIHATPNERRKEIYSLLLEHPEYIESAQAAKRIDAPLRAYTRFVLDYARTAVTAGEETTAFGFISRLANNPPQREVAKILIESDTDWTPAAAQIYALAQAVPYTIPLIKLYMKYASSGNGQKGLVDYSNLSPLERRKILDAVAHLPDEVTESLIGGDMWSLAELSMFTVPSGPTGSSIQKKSSTPHITTGYGIDEIAGIDGINPEVVRDADEYLQLLGIDGVWQDVNTSKPERVNRIGRYIINEVSSPHLPKVLGNPTLRRAYFALFDGRPEPLAKMMDGLNPNAIQYNNLARQRLTAKR